MFKKLFSNKKSVKNQLFIQCTSNISKDAVKREVINGVEHIIISSYTLPDNIVMNGGLYPAEEIDKSYISLENTLAPLEHPEDTDGNFISATDPHAIHNYHVGAFNKNVTKKDGRIHIDKYINVQEASKSDKGKRLLDRIEELETNSNPRPVHTSVGVFLIQEELKEPKVNSEQEEYSWIAREMVFDHDAILLDNIGAATPEQGVGMAVNKDGDKIDAEVFSLPNNDGKEEPQVNESFSEIREALFKAIQQPPYNGDWIEEIFEDEFVFAIGDELLKVSYIITDGKAMITGIPLPVDKKVEYELKSNEKGDAMRDLLVNALKAAGITVNEDISDDELLAKYNQLQANQEESEEEEEEEPSEPSNADAITEAVTNALKPVTDKLTDLENKLNANKDEEVNKYASIIGNSDKYPALTADDAKLLPLDKLKEMAANCQTAYGIPGFNVNLEGGNDDQSVPTEMPE